MTRLRFAIQPDYVPFFQRAELTHVEDFFRLHGTVVSGHPNRQVEHVLIDDGTTTLRAYLKREHHVPWKERVENALAGFGFVSKSWRELQILSQIREECTHVPEWLAAGEDHQGRAFLLLREVPDAVPLPQYLQTAPDDNPVSQRLRMARQIGQILAELHQQGVQHVDLYASHLLIQPDTQQVVLVDWQRARRYRRLSWRQRCRDLAALSATLPKSLGSPVERAICLRTYFRTLTSYEKPTLSCFLSQIQAEVSKLQRRRHVRNKAQRITQLDSQSLIALEEGKLHVTEEFYRQWPDGDPNWLQQVGVPRDQKTVRQQLTTTDNQEVVTTITQRHVPWYHRWKLSRRPWLSPERRQAGILHRLQRTGLVVPRILAVGERELNRTKMDCALAVLRPQNESSIAKKLSYLPRVERIVLLKELGNILADLHSAGCFFRNTTRGLSLRTSKCKFTFVLSRSDDVTLRRRRSWSSRRRNLRTLSEELRLRKSDLAHLVSGYVRRAIDNGDVSLTERRHLKELPLPASQGPGALASDRDPRKVAGTRRLTSSARLDFV